MKKKIAAQTFGCKINQYETACILDDFIAAGYEIVDFNQKADVYLINSCTVTNRTDYKSRNALRKALKRKASNPEIKIVVTGCYSQINNDKIQEMGDIDLIIDNNNKNNILSILNGKEYDFCNIFDYTEFSELSTETMLDRSRAFLKVQDGCNFFCAYCTVPFGRGNPRSRDPHKVIQQVKLLVQKGFHEFVVGGVNLGLYGIDHHYNVTLPQLLRQIEAINGVEIIRLSSIEPQLFSNELLDFLRESKKIAPHFHIPLQSGCNSLLKTMGRHYTTDQFKEKINLLKSIYPDAAFGFDVIAGLPGETEQYFMETFNFLKSIDFTYLHVFSYSKRPGTKAYTMKNQVNGSIIKERVSKLTELSLKKMNKYIRYLLKSGIQLKGIIENEQGDYWSTLSDHFIRCYVKDNNLINKQVCSFKPIEYYKDGIKGIKID